MSFTFRNVSKHFGSLVAIDRLSMTFDPGMIYAIIGPNGAGKSTLVNMAAGSYSVSSGSILFDEMPLEGRKKYEINLAGIARTYQNIRLFDQMTVIENLEVALAPSALGRTWREVLWPSVRGGRPGGSAADLPPRSGGVRSGGGGGCGGATPALRASTHARDRTRVGTPSPCASSRRAGGGAERSGDGHPQGTARAASPG